MRRSIFLAFLFITSWCNLAWGQSQSLEINGPSEIASGQLIRLDAQLDPDESPLWIVLSPPDLDYEQVDGGRRLIFAVDDRQVEPITILLLAQQIENDRIVTRQVRRTLTIRSDEADEPEPNPEDPDLKKSPLFRLVFEAWDSLESLAARNKTSLIADNFESVAKRCEQGSFSELPQVWKALSKSNQDVLGEQTEDWEPVGLAMQSGFADLRLKTIPEHAFHLRAVASALRSKSDE